VRADNQAWRDAGKPGVLSCLAAAVTVFKYPFCIPYFTGQFMNKRTTNAGSVVAIALGLLTVTGCSSSTPSQPVAVDPSAAAALIGSWSCGDGSRFSFLADGSALVSVDSKPDGDSMMERATTKGFAHYQTSGNEVSIRPDYSELTIAPQDYNQIDALVKSGTVQFVRPGTIRISGAGVVIVSQFAIDGDTLTEHQIRMSQKGVDSHLPESAKVVKTCSRISS
jgi:hypothetical protein